MIGPYGEPNEVRQASGSIGCGTCVLTVNSDGAFIHEEHCTIQMYADRDIRLARLVEALTRIDNGDQGDWTCACPAGEIARAALADFGMGKS